MTQVNINNVTSFASSTIDGIDKINFNYLGKKVYSASKIQTIYGVFVSNVIAASDYFLKWHNITWQEYKDNTFDVQLFIKSANTSDELAATTWSGPFIDGSVEMNNQYGKYVQFCIVLRKTNTSTVSYPVVSSISLKYYTSDVASRFYTRTFKVGFTPKTVVLTYNADTTDDALIRFAISGIDSADTSYYQYIDANKIVQLDSIAYLSDSIKVMMEIIGSSQSQTVVHEFALMFSGDEAFRLNKVYNESSSSTSSSSTSESSSSSIDSSSSSSSSSTSSSSSSS
jgi:hypothetical protein